MDEKLADRIRSRLSGHKAVSERRMFGGICFMLDGNMVAASMKNGALLARVGESGMRAALARPGAAAMEMGGRQMKGFTVVEPGAIADATALASWLDASIAFVRTLPPK